MSFKPMNTKDATTGFRKTLVLAEAGFGKTTQAKYFQEHYGKGFIISGEAGLSSIRSAGIDFLPFSSFDGANDPSKNVYSFTGICRALMSPEFQAAGYKWLMLDSYTELSDMIWQWAVARVEREAAESGKKDNAFNRYVYTDEKAIAAAKFIRDLPYHVVITGLVKEKENDDGSREILPMVATSKTAKQLPGIFDNVLYGTTIHEKAKPAVGDQPATPAVTRRFFITGKYGNYNGKVRDEHRAVALVEETASIVDVLKKIEAAEAKA